MADTDNAWALKMDKVAYAVAGGVALIVLCVPTLLGGRVDTPGLRSELETFTAKVEEFKNKLRQEPDETPDLSGALAAQWDAGPALDLDPRWVTERAPALIRKVERPPATQPTHVAGELKEISCARDAEKKVPYLLLKGAVSGGNEHVVISRVKILRKDSDGKEFQTIAEIAGDKLESGAFTYADSSVEAGKSYTYKFVDEAERDPNSPPGVVDLKPEEKAKESNELGPTKEIPYDCSLVIQTIQPLASPTDTPKFFGKFKYWDYKAGKVVEVASGSLTSFSEKQKVGEGSRWEFFSVDDIGKAVTVRDLLKNTRAKILVKDARTDRPVDCWEAPLTSAAPAGGEAEGGAEEAVEPAEKPSPKKPTTEKTTTKKTGGATKKEDTTKPKKGGLKFK